jgi:hypothetical protein
MDIKRLILVSGWFLIGVAFLSATIVGIIAVAEDVGIGMVYPIAGRPVVFLPIAYISILITGAVVAVVLLLKKFWRRKSEKLEK